MAAETKTYIVKKGRKVSFNNKDFEAGKTLQLADEHAASLLEVDAIEEKVAEKKKD